MRCLPLSIVIPTRNRKPQCLETVRAVLSYAQEYELVIFDTSDDDELASMVDRQSDPRVVYVRGPQGGLNMTQCFEKAVALASGRFVCMIGDDDGVTPALFDWVQRCDELGLTSVTTRPDSYALYNWVDVTSKYFGAAASGRLLIRSTRCDDYHSINLDVETAAFLAGAGQGCGLLPRVYHGLIRRDMLDSIRARFGRCFDGVSPDVSFSYFAAKCAGHHAVADAALTISGACAASNAGRSAMRHHKGDLWSDPHMLRYQDEPWPSEVPEFFSVETVWAQATLRAVDREADGDRAAYGFNQLYALCLLRHSDRIFETLRAIRAHLTPQRRAQVLASIAVLFVRVGVLAFESAVKVCSKLWRRVWPDPLVRSFRAATVIEASRIVEIELKKSRP